MNGKRSEKVEFSTLVRAIPELVYDSLATADGLDAWFTNGSSVDVRKGGLITFRWKEWGPDRYTGETAGPVVEASRPKLFVFQWPADSDPYYTTVEIRFEPVREGTIVRLAEFGFDDTASGLKDMLARAVGWGEALTLMKVFVEHGTRY